MRFLNMHFVFSSGDKLYYWFLADIYIR